MIKSMTGYGRSEHVENGIRYLVELKSVNHRYCEISIRLPKELSPLEDRIKRWIQEDVKRGRVEVQISLDTEEQRDISFEVNWPLVDQYMEIARKMEARYDLKHPISADQLLQLQDAIELKERDRDVEMHADGLRAAVTDACKQLLSMRREEGRALEQDLRQRVRRIEALIGEVVKQAPNVVAEYRERLLQRLEEWLQNREIDESRLLTEVALFADRSDIQEELTRLDSHCRQFNDILERDEPVGRKLDFLIQEMNREMNTIGSKANDLMISQRIVDMKSELEKIREQVQNIE